MLESLDTLAPFAVPLAAVLGLVIGSFLNVVIYRTPVMMERGWTQFAKEHLQLDLTEEERHPLPEMPCSGQGMAEYPDCQLSDARR